MRLDSHTIKSEIVVFKMELCHIERDVLAYGLTDNEIETMV